MKIYNQTKTLASSKMMRFGAIVLVAMLSLSQLMFAGPVFADTGGYTWPDATYVDANYDWGYSSCPGSDTGCMTMYGFLNGVKYGEADPWVYYLRNCTSYVAWKINQVFGKNISGWGNATSWNTSALNAGYTNDTSPQVGDIAQWNGTTSNPAGHVAYVYSVSQSGVASYDQYNYAGDGNFTSNYTSATQGSPDHYIHIGNVSNSNSTVRTIPTSDGHIQTFKISNGTLSENWYNPPDGTVGGWTQPVAMPSTPVGTSAVVLRSGTNKIDVFVRGSNNQLYTTWYDFQYGTWGGWIGMGGGPLGFTSDPQAVATSDGHYQVFGTGGGYVEQNWFNPNGTYGGWSTSAGGITGVGSPAVVPRSGQNVIDEFVHASNNQVYETWYEWDNGHWGGWIGMGVGPLSFTSDPQAVATSDGHDQVLGTGGGYVEQNWFSPNGTYGGWSTSAGLSASAVGSPALAVRSGQNVIDGFVRGNNNQVYSTWYNFGSGQWGGWIGMGGGPKSVTSDPQVQLTSDGNDQVFGTGGGLVEQNWFNPNGTYGGWISF